MQVPRGNGDRIACGAENAATTSRSRATEYDGQLDFRNDGRPHNLAGERSSSAEKEINNPMATRPESWQQLGLCCLHHQKQTPQRQHSHLPIWLWQPDAQKSVEQNDSIGLSMSRAKQAIRHVLKTIECSGTISIAARVCEKLGTSNDGEVRSPRCDDTVSTY